MSNSINAELACDVLKNAVEFRRPSEEVLHHSDRGIQYSSDVFHELLDKYNMKCSMSATVDPWSNACQVSFFGKLKTEWIRGRVYKTHEEAKQDIFKYIEIFYNRHRRHAKLGYLSPVGFEEMKSK